MAEITSSSYLRQIVKFALHIFKAAFISFVSAVNEQVFIFLAKVERVLLPQHVQAADPLLFVQALTKV